MFWLKLLECMPSMVRLKGRSDMQIHVSGLDGRKNGDPKIN